MILKTVWSTLDRGNVTFNTFSKEQMATSNQGEIQTAKEGMDGGHRKHDGKGIGFKRLLSLFKMFDTDASTRCL